MKKFIVFFLLFFCFVAIVGGIGTLFYVDVESSNFFAIGQTIAFGYLAWLVWPKIKTYIK